jgi:hypothetical protein
MKKIVIHAFLVSLLGAIPQYCLGTSTDEEVARQVARQISQAVSKRIRATSSESTSLGGSGIGPSSEGGINAWLNPQYTDIASYRAPGNTSIYSMVGGADTRMGNLFLGLGMSYARAETAVSGLSQDFNSDNYSFDPYFGYTFNKHVFATAILGYSHSEPTSTISSPSNGFLGDFSINGILPMNQLDLSGKAGWRTSYISLDNPQAFAQSVAASFSGPSTIAAIQPSDHIWTNTYYLSSEAGYTIDRFRPYFNAAWEHIKPATGGGSSTDLDLVFSTVGVDYKIADAIKVGVNYTRELTTNSGINYNAAGATLKMKF